MTWRMAAMSAAGLLVLVACGEHGTALEGAGDPSNGRLLLQQYPCGSCHRIPGVANAYGNVGPPLERIGRRVYLAGRLPNTPENMALWIRAPQRIDPLTAMPDLQVPQQHARDMTAYLQSLR